MYQFPWATFSLAAHNRFATSASIVNPVEGLDSDFGNTLQGDSAHSCYCGGSFPAASIKSIQMAYNGDCMGNPDDEPIAADSPGNSGLRFDGTTRTA